MQPPTAAKICVKVEAKSSSGDEQPIDYRIITDHLSLQSYLFINYLTIWTLEKTSALISKFFNSASFINENSGLRFAIVKIVPLFGSSNIKFSESSHNAL